MSVFYKFIRCLKEWNELFSIPIGVAIFALAPLLLHQIDPTSAAYDVGTLHAVLFAVAAFCILKGAAWLALRMDFPGVYRWLDDRMEEELLPKGKEEVQCDSERSSWRRARLLLALFALYLLPLVALTVAMI